MRLLQAGSKDFSRQLEKLERLRAAQLDRAMAEAARIIAAVRRRGDRALIDFAARFDGLAMSRSELRLAPERLEELAARADADLVREIRRAIGNITRFHKHQVEKSWTIRDNGAVIGQRILPLQSVGLYVPGGKAAYPSTVIMNAVPARVAGVARIAVATPPRTLAENPAVAATLRALGLTEVYLCGGAQAIAALAYGTETIKPVDKIVGPGNIYVAAAKRLVFGQVDIDMIAGPSEIVIVADRSANPSYVAADMLSQAEHDESATAMCVTTSAGLARAVRKEIKRQLPLLARRKVAARSLARTGSIILARSLEEAAEVVNRIAPEHVELVVERPERAARLVRNAGALFLGGYSPQPVGDYFAGPNHVLPTGGAARYGSPLGVYDFIKRTSLIRYSRARLAAARRSIERLALAEGLEAHARAVAIRFENR